MSIFGVGPALAVAGGTTFLLDFVLQRIVGLSLRAAAAGWQIAGFCWDLPILARAELFCIKKHLGQPMSKVPC